jgi:hypothetical protein
LRYVQYCITEPGGSDSHFLAQIRLWQLSRIRLCDSSQSMMMVYGVLGVGYPYHRRRFTRPPCCHVASLTNDPNLSRRLICASMFLIAPSKAVSLLCWVVTVSAFSSIGKTKNGIGILHASQDEPVTARRQILFSGTSALAFFGMTRPANSFSNKISDKYDDRPKRKGPQVGICGGLKASIPACLPNTVSLRQIPTSVTA